MSEKLKKSMKDEADRLLQHSRTLEPGSIEHQQVIEDAIKLIKASDEMDAKTDEKSERKKERWIRLGLGAGALFVSGCQLVVHVKEWREMTQIETTGSIASQGGKQLISNMFKFVK